MFNEQLYPAMTLLLLYQMGRRYFVIMREDGGATTGPIRAAFIINMVGNWTAIDKLCRQWQINAWNVGHKLALPILPQWKY